MIESYSNIGGNSGVVCFEIERNSITVWFRKGKRPYTYSYSRAGLVKVETMIRLARDGYGLNAFINLYVRDLYD